MISSISQTIPKNLDTSGIRDSYQSALPANQVSLGMKQDFLPPLWYALPVDLAGSPGHWATSAAISC